MMEVVFLIDTVVNMEQPASRQNCLHRTAGTIGEKRDRRELCLFNYEAVNPRP
jgi:hypothetical protein